MQRLFLTLLLVARSDGAEQRAPDSDNGGQRRGGSRRNLRLRIRGGQRVARHGPWRCLVRRMTATASQRCPAEQRKGASVQEVPARQRPESPLKVSWSNNGARGATCQQITHWKNEVVHSGGQRACMSEPEALMSIRNEGRRILPIPVAGVADRKSVV